MRCRLKSCPKCQGDLLLDGDEWRCWQCGQYYYPHPPCTAPPEIEASDLPGLGVGGSIDAPKRRRRSERGVNSLISATDRNENRWWNHNREVVRYLDEGRTVREIASLVGRSPRQIRVVRERLNDMRDCGPE